MIKQLLNYLFLIKYIKFNTKIKDNDNYFSNEIINIFLEDLNLLLKNNINDYFIDIKTNILNGEVKKTHKNSTN